MGGNGEREGRNLKGEGGRGILRLRDGCLYVSRVSYV